MEIGFIGLGKMGTRMVEKLLSEGNTVVGWNRTAAVVDQFRLGLVEKKLDGYFIASSDIKSLVTNLPVPRVVWVMLPAGDATQSVLDEVVVCLEKGDIVIDGGNANYKDTEKRRKVLSEKGIRFLGIGVSGGIKAAENGYPLMAGGDKSAYDYIKPILVSLAKPGGGYDYFGEGGAGHFIKMVHNGIEYGMMQAIGEGFGVLEKASYHFDLLRIASLWQKGTIVTSFLVDRAKDALEKDPKLSEIAGVIGKASGEAVWTVDEAKHMDVPIENIEQALSFRNRSETDEKIQKSFAAKMVSALRREFGGHAIKRKEA